MYVYRDTVVSLNQVLAMLSFNLLHGASTNHVLKSHFTLHTPTIGPLAVFVPGTTSNITPSLLLKHLL